MCDCNWWQPPRDRQGYACLDMLVLLLFVLLLHNRTGVIHGVPSILPCLLQETSLVAEIQNCRNAEAKAQTSLDEFRADGSRQVCQ